MDALKLEYKIKKSGFSIGEFAKTVGISRTSFYRKCRGKAEFTLSEITKIMEVLELETPVGIFFEDKVS